jgi:hypothetical protein
MRQAQHQLDDDRRIVVWVELVVLAHLLGFASPKPGAGLAADLLQLERRTLECAVAHAVERSIAARSTQLCRHYSPSALAGHVAAVLLAQVDDQESPCGAEDTTWQAGPFRWNHIRGKLKEWKGDGDGQKPPHPGVDVEGATCAEQITLVQSWADREEPAREIVLFGNATPSPLEVALGRERLDAGWRSALKAAYVAVDGIEQGWPLAYLAASTSSGEPAR